MSDFTLKYGQREIEFDLPTDCSVSILKPKPMPGIESISDHFHQSIQHPVNSPPLSQIIKSGDRVAIIVSDKTRTSKADILLPLLREELRKCGLRDKNLFIVFAAGTHSSHTQREQIKIIGEDIAGKIEFFDHDCDDTHNLKYLGTTSRRTPVYLNKRVWEADKIILTGGISYHYFAGYQGGRKSVIPGIAARETIKANHSWCMNFGAEGGNNPQAQAGKLEGNPVHEDMLEGASLLLPHFLINIILNERLEIASLVCGDFIQAHKRGCELLDSYCRISIKEKADLVVVSCGGSPKDINFIQAHKAMDNSAYALKEGGTMIVAAECGEGLGSSKLAPCFAFGSVAELREELRRNFTISGHTVYTALKKAEKFNIILVSRFPKEKVEKMGMQYAASLEEAIQMSKSNLPASPKTYIIPDGYNILPELELS